MPPKIVLFNPEIPQNTGNIARLTAAMRTELHLIEPLGFELSDKQVRRAGLDYWPETDVHVHKSWESFLEDTYSEYSSLWFFSTKAQTPYFEVSYQENDFLVFGSETKGFPAFIHEEYSARRVLIPMENPNVRSLNLANAAAVGLLEARRQITASRRAES